VETIGIVLNIDADRTDEFEVAFRQHELPIWEDYVASGVMLHASLARLDISTQPVKGAVQYLINVAFADERGHHLHDDDPRFQAWNEMADTFQVEKPMVTGGAVVVSAGQRS
jgi:hypothetical protein